MSLIGYISSWALAIPCTSVVNHQVGAYCMVYPSIPIHQSENYKNIEKKLPLKCFADLLYGDSKIIYQDRRYTSDAQYIYRLFREFPCKICIYTLPQKKRRCTPTICPVDPGSLTLTKSHVNFMKWS